MKTGAVLKQASARPAIKHGGRWALPHTPHHTINYCKLSIGAEKCQRILVTVLEHFKKFVIRATNPPANQTSPDGHGVLACKQGRRKGCSLPGTGLGRSSRSRCRLSSSPSCCNNARTPGTPRVAAGAGKMRDGSGQTVNFCPKMDCAIICPSDFNIALEHCSLGCCFKRVRL